MRATHPLLIRTLIRTPQNITIVSPGVLFAVNVLAGIEEFLDVTSVPKRDKAVYHLFSKCCTKCFGGKQWVGFLGRPKNNSLRTCTTSIETALEVQPTASLALDVVTL